MDVLQNTIYAREAFLPISLPATDLLGNYVPFVRHTGVAGLGQRDHRAYMRNVSYSPRWGLLAGLPGDGAGSNR